MRFLIVITGYNAGAYVAQCLESVRRQTYDDYQISIVDDGSTDDTWQKIRDLAPEWAAISRNTQNKGTYFARDKAINKVPDKSYDVIVLLDMDDELKDNALELVNEEYEKGVYMTYGNWENHHGEICQVDITYSDVVHLQKTYRQDTFRCTHLRTFRKELYFAIPKWELNIGEVRSYPDVELLFSMMEMCSKERIGVINKVIYMYRDSQPLSTLRRFGKDHLNYKLICDRPARREIQL